MQSLDDHIYLTPKGKRISRAAVARRLAAGKPVQAQIPLGGSAASSPVQGSLFTDTVGQQIPNLQSNEKEVRRRDEP